MRGTEKGAVGVGLRRELWERRKALKKGVPEDAKLEWLFHCSFSYFYFLLKRSPIPTSLRILVETNVTPLWEATQETTSTRSVSLGCFHRSAGGCQAVCAPFLWLRHHLSTKLWSLSVKSVFSVLKGTHSVVCTAIKIED